MEGYSNKFIIMVSDNRKSIKGVKGLGASIQPITIEIGI